MAEYQGLKAPDIQRNGVVVLYSWKPVDALGKAVAMDHLPCLWTKTTVSHAEPTFPGKIEMPDGT